MSDVRYISDELITEIEELAVQKMFTEDDFLAMILNNEDTLKSVYIKGVQDGKIELAQKIVACFGAWRNR